MSLNKKYDIFISYRHNNMTLICELVHKLSRYYDIFWDQRLESGFWEEQLERAIDNSKVVLINFSHNSLKKNETGEDWFYREIIYSMTTKKKEEIIPICYDGFNFPKDFYSFNATDIENEKLSLLRDKYQHITNLGELDKIVERVVQFLEGLGITPKEPYSPSSDSNYYLKISEFAPSRFFKGRAMELAKLEELVLTNDMVFLSGMGGIGKTELAKKFMSEATGQYRCIFCKFEGSLKNTLSKLEIAGLSSTSFDEREQILRKLLDRNVLLIIDNFDFESDLDIDLYINEFASYPCKKLITTRNTFGEIEFPERTDFLHIGNLSNDELKELFEDKYGKAITAEQFDKLFKLTGGLTLAMPILASFCLKAGISVDALCEKTAVGLKGLENTESIHYSKDGNQKGNIPEILRLLFNLENMSEGKKKTLANLSLLQFLQVTKDVYRKFAFPDGEGNLDDLNDLVSSSWINEFIGELGESCYELHPIIDELVKTDLHPSPSVCPEIFGRFELKKREALDMRVFDVNLWANFILSININEKENYDFLISQLKNNYISLVSYRTIGKLSVLTEKVKNIILQKDILSESDFFLATHFINSFIGNPEAFTKISDKCAKARKNKQVSKKVMSGFMASFASAANQLPYACNSAKDPLFRFFESYVIDNFRYVPLRYRKRVKKNILHAKKSFEKDNLTVNENLTEKESNTPQDNAFAKKIRNAGSYKKAFELLSEANGKYNTKEFFKENIFDVFLKEDMSREDAKDLLSTAAASFDDYQLLYVYQIDTAYYLRTPFLSSYISRNLSMLTYDDFIEYFTAFGSDKTTSELLSAMAFCDSDKITEILKELISHDLSVNENEFFSKSFKTFDKIRSALADFPEAYFFDAQSDILFDYTDAQVALHKENSRSESILLNWYEFLCTLFSDKELVKKAAEKRRAYELSIGGFILRKKD